MSIKRLTSIMSFDVGLIKINPYKSTSSDWINILNEYGVVVLTDFLNKETCDKHVGDIVDWLCKKSEGLTRDPSTWTKEKIPYGPRDGMMQNIVSHCPTVWECRKLLYPVFYTLWNDKDLITSIDGATVYPPIPKKRKDWPHIDQTLPEPENGKDVVIGKTALCVQGQLALTNTTASFRCSPKSHLFHKHIMKLHNVEPNLSHWLKIESNTEQCIKEWLKYYGGAWQVPIHVPAGSVILWKSNLIHSAQYVEKVPTEEETSIDPWAGWRCTVYVCQRPKKHFSKRNLNTVRKSAKEGRTTNHWGTKMFPKRPGARWGKNRIPKIDDLCDNLVSLNISDDFNDTLKNLTDL